MTLHEYRPIATDDTLRETSPHGCGAYPFAYYLEDVWLFDFHRIDWHWHHEVEWVTVREGRLICLVGKDRLELSAGEGLFVNSGVLHRYEAEGKAVAPNIVFSPALLAPAENRIYHKYILPVIHSAAAYQVFRPQTEWQGHILNTLMGIYRLQEDGSGDEIRTVQMLLEIWRILFEHLERGSEAFGQHHINHSQARLQQMMQYIHDHYQEQILLDDIAAAASVSKSSALNLFRTGIHISPISYLIRYRLQCAGRLLSSTEEPVSIIAEESGFSNISYFCRKFKEYYRMTPNEYRRTKKQ